MIKPLISYGQRKANFIQACSHPPSLAFGQDPGQQDWVLQQPVKHDVNSFYVHKDNESKEQL